MKRTSALLGALSAALMLSATLPATAAQATADVPLRAVYGGIVTADNPALPIGAKLPPEFAAKTPNPATPPSLPNLTQAQENAAKQPPASPATPAKGEFSPAATEADNHEGFVTVKWCRDNYGAAPGARVIDRYNWCATRPSVIYYIDSEGAIKGTTNFRMITAGQAQRAQARKAFFTAGFDLFIDAGQTLPAATTRLEITYTTSGYSDWDGSNVKCTVVGFSPNTVAGWKAGTTSNYEITSDKGEGYSGDRVSRCGVAQWGISDVNPTWAQLQRTNIRQDSAQYIGSTGGTIFTDFTPVFRDYYRDNADHGAVARHIWDAQNMPVNTYPSSPNKAVPGSIASGKPLHRAVEVAWDPASSTRVQDNRRVRTAACNVLSPGGAPAGQDCDEYPFASTWEGAGVGDGNYSVRWLNSRENNNAGTLLSQWYGSQRVIGRELFYLEVG
ncbi:NucA/NucB deoxyribonuclease domain-containing protein [Streptomyces goshikiensis]|uniref:NucA/NucB deoxyribonuclease domain-containing protein n=1 Tax=Streptomyces goshikiensis TaxID=1942 RepID=UPI00381CEC51